MRKFIQNKLRDQKGLTLIELLAVIVILAIIAAIAIPAIGNIIENSRVGAAKSDGLNAFAAADLYLIDNPDAFTATAQDGITALELTNGGYLEDLGSFTGTGATLTGFTLNSTSKKMELTATAVNGKVKVVYTKALKTDIQAVPNTAGKTGVTTPSTITVTR